MGGVEPVIDELDSIAAFALGDLVLVMGKEQVDAARVNIEIVAEMFLAHRGAFEMPTGTTFSPGRIPVVGAVFLATGFPEDKIGR